MQSLAIIGIGSLRMYYQVMFAVYCILYIIGYFYNVLYNDDTAAVGIGGADLFISGIV